MDVSSTIAAVSLAGSAAQVNRLYSKIGGHPALVLYSSNEPGELSQWQCHDDSTVNIVVRYYYYYCYATMASHMQIYRSTRQK